jgi:hypothetical protein
MAKCIIIRSINEQSLFWQSPSNKPLEWTGHRQLLLAPPRFLPATQEQRSEERARASMIQEQWDYQGLLTNG